MPARVLDQPAAGDRADGDAEPGDGRPAPIAFGRSSGGEDGGDDRQRRRHDERAADAHQRARGDQHLGARRPGADRPSRGRRSARPKRERALAAEAVAERARGEQQTGEDQHVGVDDPLQLGARRAEVALEGGQGDVEDGVVEPDHEQRRGRGPPGSTSGGDPVWKTSLFRFVSWRQGTARRYETQQSRSEMPERAPANGNSGRVRGRSESQRRHECHRGAGRDTRGARRAEPAALPGRC